MKPIGRMFFAEKIQTEEKTSSGIILPEKSKKQNKYKVVAVGANVTVVRVGDTIKKYHGSVRPSLEYEGRYVEVLRENEDVEFVLKPE